MNLLLCPVEGGSLDPEILWMPEDRERLSLFRTPVDRERFLLGRLMLRFLWQEHEDGPVADLCWGPAGKPAWNRVGASSFSISHSGEWVGLAWRKEGELGLDLETLSRPRPWERLSRRYFSAGEQACVDSQESFLRMWCRKEARLKADGGGLGGGISSLDTSADPDWHYWELEEQTELFAALVWQGEKQIPKLCRIDKSQLL